MNFSSDLAEGQEFERAALAMLGPGWTRNPDKYGPDMLHPTLGPCECKYDRRGHRTGKIFFEVSFHGAPSGLFKYPQVKRWMQGREGSALLFKIEDLLHCVNFNGENIRGGDGNASEGRLVRWDCLAQYAEKRFDAAPRKGILPTPSGISTLSHFPMNDVFESQDIFSDPVPVRKGKNPKPGTEVGVLYGIFDVGTKELKDKETGEPYNVHNLQFFFELPGQTVKVDGVDKPMLQRDSFVKYELDTKRASSTNQKAGTTRPTLYGYAAALAGVTPKNAQDFRLKSMLGKACIISIVENGEYTNIADAKPLLRDQVAPKPFNPLVAYSIVADGFESEKFDSLPAGVRRSITESLEFAAFAQGNQAAAAKIREACKKQD